MNIKKLGKKFGCLLIGGSFLVGGNCLPDNFWIDTVDTVLTTATVTVANAYVNVNIVDPLLEGVEGE